MAEIKFGTIEGRRFIAIKCWRCDGYDIIFYPIRYSICDNCNALIKLNDEELRKINEYLKDSGNTDSGDLLIRLRKKVLKSLA